MDLNIWVALWAGLLSFISPCCLPLYPSYLSYITGVSVSNLKSDKSAQVRTRLLLHTLCFIIGFSIVFYTFGLTAGLLADTFLDSRYRDLFSKLAGVFIIVMGLILLGVFKPQLLMRDRKWQVPDKIKKAGYLGSVFIGIGFAAGWSPCIGPILGSIGALAATEQGAWFPLITAYTLGFAIPFFLVAFFLGSTKWLIKFSVPLMKIGGAIMIVMGVLLYSGKLTEITIMLQEITPDWMRNLG